MTTSTVWSVRFHFDVKSIPGEDVQVVQSLAKWKRFALKKYEFEPGYGLYTDMNAIRRDEDLDNLHSVYVDQWDWEAVIHREDRTVALLIETVKKIYEVIFGDAEGGVRGLPQADCFSAAGYSCSHHAGAGESIPRPYAKAKGKRNLQGVWCSVFDADWRAGSRAASGMTADPPTMTTGA